MSSTAGMIYQERPTSVALAPWVECVWQIDAGSANAGGEDSGAPHRVLPDGCVELIVQTGAPVIEQRLRCEPSLQPRVAIVGQLDRFLRLQSEGPMRTIGIRFRPEGARSFLGVPVHELTGMTLEVGELLGDRVARSFDSVTEAHEPMERLEAVCGSLFEGVAPVDGSIRAAVGVLLRSGGRVRISDLTRFLGVDERTLQRRFTAHVGLRPKQFARIARLQSVLAELATPRSSTLADVAYACGFSDQAHLNREFKALAGYTPGEWWRESHEFADRFASEQRWT